MAVIKGGSAVNISFTQTGAIGVSPADDLAAAVLNLRSIFSASGTLLDQCDLLHAKTYTFAASTPQTLDLTALTDVVGNAIAFARARFVAMRIQNTTSGNILLVGGAASNEWTGFQAAGSIMKVFPSTANNDGYTIIQAPNTAGMVVSGGSKNLKLDPGSVALGLVDVIIAGCSA